VPDGLRFKQLIVSFLRRAIGRTQAGFPTSRVSHPSSSSNVRSRPASPRSNQPRHSSWRSALRSSRRSGPTLCLPHGCPLGLHRLPNLPRRSEPGKPRSGRMLRDLLGIPLNDEVFKRACLVTGPGVVLHRGLSARAAASRPKRGSGRNNSSRSSNRSLLRGSSSGRPACWGRRTPVSAATSRR
jgi:hypothetical protein